MNDTPAPDPKSEGSAGPFATLGQRAPLAADPPPQASDVGTLLCATRMRLGKDLQDIAAILHIRYNFLVAIEDGRYEDLPGQAYAIGFVRAYADHLGLDGDEVVRRYKEETAGIKRATRYEYPIPPPESGIPSGALLMIAVVLGMVVYGVWYSLADAERRAADVIQEIPARLTALLGGDASAPSAPPETQVAETAPAPADEAVEPPPETPPADAAGTLAENQVAALAPPPAVPNPSPPQAAAPAPPTAAPAPQPSATAAPAPASAPSPPATAAPTGAPASQPARPADVRNTAPGAPSPRPPPPTVAGAPPAGGSAPAATTTPAPRPATSPPAQAPAPATGAPAPRPAPAAAQTAAAGRGTVELRAKSDSWIQVRDGEQLLLTRFLRKGESYRVPDRPGLTLMTLNAGGIEIVVDGQPMPPLGDAGSVARGVSLDPAKLKAMPKPATPPPPAPTED